jgi:hypothetical protein
MRNAAWWSVLWTDRIVELPLDTPIVKLGEQAIDALGHRASRCSITQWVFDWPIFKEKIPRWEWPQLIEKFQLLDIPFEHYVAGGVLRELMLQMGSQSGQHTFPDKAPDDKELERAMAIGVEEGLAALGAQLQKEATAALDLVKHNFRVPRVKGKEAAEVL